MSRRPVPPLSALLVLVAIGSLGCANREVMEGTFDRSGVEVSLREIKRGFTVVPREFQHPLQISIERLSNMLGAIEIRGDEKELSGIRSAFEPSELNDIATGLAYGLSHASPDQEVVVSAVRKEMQHLIFDRKRLTSFVAYAQDDLLYLHFSRVDWEIPERVKKNALPIPRISEHPMKFRVIPSEGMYSEGLYAVSIEWQDPIFQSPLVKVDPSDQRRERTILLESPDRPQTRKSTLPADLLPYLTPAQLRELADLEEARQQGRLSEGHYRRAREKILDEAREQAATSD